MHACDNHFRTLPHFIDQVSEATEKCKALLCRLNSGQFFKGSASTEGFISCGSQNNNFRVFIVSHTMNFFRQFFEYSGWQRIALWMEKFNGGNAVMNFRSNVTAF